jgi:hypothetical protein
MCAPGELRPQRAFLDNELTFFGIHRSVSLKKNFGFQNVAFLLAIFGDDA